MTDNHPAILPFEDRHRDGVTALWRAVFGYPADYNEPGFVIDAKVARDRLFWVAEAGGEESGLVVGTIMAGYDGHRGWIYSLAVHPDQRGRRLGTRLLDRALAELKALGCVKVNLQILESNETVRRFYEANGFTVEPRLSMGRRLD
ncbi:MAG: GNAT family acetyltransferase [Pseudodesulfovibrio sp.]|uniref:GNAT family acetyltransferase n=1 Tax=Pseudodesulfovibrio sp. TaxID=2035812 RepID=UPI003D0CEDB9